MTKFISRVLFNPALWASILMQSIAIVGSILFAFGIDAWWQENLERHEEQAALRALRVEFTSNVNRFRSAHEFHLRVAEDIHGLTQNISGLPLDQSIEVQDSLLMSLASFITSEAATGTMDTLLASGKIDLIQDSELQQTLAELSSVLEDTDEDEVGVRSFVLDKLIPGLAEHSELSALLARRTAQPLTSGNAYGPGESTYQLTINPVTRSLVSERHFLAQILLRSSERRTSRAELALELIERLLQEGD